MFKFRKRIYRRPGELYLTRYYLIDTPWLGVYIHKLYQSDLPVPHDHPWDFITCPLRIGYVEYDEEGRDRLRLPFRILHRKAESFHWLEKLDNRPAWTLFIRFKRRREWGFLVKERGVETWISAKDYGIYSD